MPEDHDDHLGAVQSSDPAALREAYARLALELDRVTRERSAMAQHAQETAATVAALSQTVEAVEFSQASMETRLEEHVQAWGAWSADLSASVSEIRGTLSTVSYSPTATVSVPTTPPPPSPPTVPEPMWTHHKWPLILHGRSGRQLPWLVAGIFGAALVLWLAGSMGWRAADFRRAQPSAVVSPSLQVPAP